MFIFVIYRLDSFIQNTITEFKNSQFKKYKFHQSLITNKKEAQKQQIFYIQTQTKQVLINSPRSVSLNHKMSHLKNLNTIFQAIKSSDNKTAKQLIQNFITKFQNVLDTQNSSLLHIASNNVNYEFAEYLLQRYDKLIEEQADEYTLSSKKKWINKKDNEGFTSLHYAVFRGNQKIAFLLEKHCADIYSINTQGLTVLHIAAQGDSPLLMFYYLNKGLKIGVTDSKGSTALHWACYSGQQNACNALLSWDAQIDCQDFTYGMTPLHLAVMSGNGRIVKKLLIRGCDRKIPNYSGKLPLDIAKQNDYKNISQMIIDKAGIQQLLNVKNPFRKIGKRTFPFYFFLIVFFTNYILNVSFVITPHFSTQTQLSIVFLALGLLTVLSFVIVSVVNPGYLKPSQPKNYFQMLVRNKPSTVCYDCKIVKPQRSRHCEICDSCVMVYDHHCPWVGNCVGARNYKFFFMFLILIETFIFYNIFFQIINIQKIDWKEVEGLEIVRVCAIFFSLATGLLFILPLTFLIFVQCKNLFANKTTFERYGYQQKTRRDSSMSSNSMRSSLLKNDSQTGTIFGEKCSSSSKKTYDSIEESSCGINCYRMMCKNSEIEKYEMTEV